MNAFLFPGQGSQEIGMGKDLYEELPEAKALLDQANEILEYDLKEMMFNGPSDLLTETQYAQPAIYTCSAMHLAKAKAEGIEYTYTAGHSLGEYSALYAAGVFSFEEGLKLVNQRGKIMAAQNGKGGMAAILGLTEEELRPYIVPGVVMANLNTKTQIVISGTTDGIRCIEERFIGNDNVKVRKLNVSAAFHSPQMEEAAHSMKTVIDQMIFKSPTAFVVSNVTGKMTKEPSEIKANLAEQITGQVRWYDSICTLIAAGTEQFYEVGHGQVLRKMNKAISLRPKCLSV